MPTNDENKVTTDDQENVETSTTNDDDPAGVEETFDRPYVEKLRKEAGDNRVKAKEQEETIDKLQRRIFEQEVKALGLLADPTDLEYDPALLEEDGKIEETVKELLARKPHLAKRVPPRGDAGLGVGPTNTGDVDILGIMRNNL